MITESLCLEIEGLLPYLTNRAEAESLIGVTILAHQLHAAVIALVAATKHEHLLESLHADILSSSNKFNRAVRPLIGKARKLVVKRRPVQLEHIANILEELRKAEVAVRQYGTQNSALAKELDGTAPQVAAAKLHLSRVEMDLCEKIEVLIKLAANQDALKGEFAKKVEMLDPESDLQRSQRSEGAEMRRKRARSEARANIPSARSTGTGGFSDIGSPADILRLYQSSAETDSPFLRAKHANSEENDNAATESNPSSDIASEGGGGDAVPRKAKRKGVPGGEFEDDKLGDEENHAMGSQNSSQPQSIELTTNNAHL